MFMTSEAAPTTLTFVLQHQLKSWLLHFNPAPANVPGKAGDGGPRPWSPANK